MITFFPTLIVAAVYCSLIKNTKSRRAVQTLVVISYGLLGAMYP